MAVVWVDAQLPPRLARWLSTRDGVVAAHVADLGLLAAEDPEIFARAGEAGATLVTRDRDFLDLLERNGPPPSVLWVTVGNCSNAVLLVRFALQWDEVVALLAAGEPLVELA